MSSSSRTRAKGTTQSGVPRGNEVHAAAAAIAHPSWPSTSSSQHQVQQALSQQTSSSCSSTPWAHSPLPPPSPPLSSTTTPTFTTATTRIQGSSSPSSTYLTEPDPYDPELDVQLLHQRQRLQRLRTIDRPTSLLAKLKAPSLFGSRNAVSSPPQTSYGAQPSTPVNATLSLPSASGAIDSSPTPSSSSYSAMAVPTTTSASAESEGSKRKGLPREYGEVSQDVEIWMPDQRGSGAGISRLAFGPKVTRKLTRHNSSASHRLPTANSSPTSIPHEPGRFKQFSPARLREKPSKLKFGSSSAASGQGAASSHPVPSGLTGSWSKGRLTLRDNDVLYILEEGALLHPLRASALRPTDVRPVDDSLLSRGNVLGIFALPSNFAGGRSFDWDSYSPISGSTDSGQVESPAPLAPILLCFPSAIRMRQWMALLRSCGTSEIYGGPSSVAKGGSHRWHREVDIHVSAFRFLASATAPSPSSPRAQEVLLPLVVPDGPPSPTTVLSRVKSLMSDTSTDQEVDEAHPPRPRAAILERSTSAMSQVSLSSGASGDVSAASCEDNYAAAGTSAPLWPVASGGSSQLPAPQPSKPEPSRRDRESSMPAVSFTSLCCMIVCDDIIMGRTEARAPQSAVGSVSWDDPTLSLYNPWPLRTLRLDLQAAVGSTRAGQQRGLTLGSVEFNIDTMRRGEEIEGWFPVWATSVRESYPPQLSISDECIGEVNLKIKVDELAVLQRRKYKAIENALNHHSCTQLISGLALHLNESVVMDYLVEIYTSSGTIADRLINLIDAEQTTWNKAPLELLFRSHSLVTRCLEKFQRLHCQHWLDASIGDLVRRICEERVTVDSDAVQAVDGGATLAMNSKDADTLHSWVVAIWESIYVNRQKCPKDLQKVLTKVRQATNSAFLSHGPSAGVQGVGCFVFLRLMCAAMINPQLYGLTATMPEPEVSKTLKSIAKVLNALANKRGPAAHYDKDLGQLNDFLHEQSAAFDDYIVSVSSYTEASSSSSASKASKSGGDVNDTLIQRIIDKRSPRLPLLHRESILSGPYMLDQSVALAAFVSYVARATDVSIFDGSGGDEADSVSGEGRGAEEKVQSFIEACCEVESLAGWYIDRAGFDPQPLNLVEYARAKTQSVSTPYSTVATGRDVAAYRPPATVVAASGEVSSSLADSAPEPEQQGEQSSGSRSSRRRATVSTAAVHRDHERQAPIKVEPAGLNTDSQDRRLTETIARQQLHHPNGSRPSTSTGQSTIRRRSVDTAFANAAAAAAVQDVAGDAARAKAAMSSRPTMRNRGASVGNSSSAGGDGKKMKWWRRIV